MEKIILKTKNFIYKNILILKTLSMIFSVFLIFYSLFFYKHTQSILRLFTIIIFWVTYSIINLKLPLKNEKQTRLFENLGNLCFVLWIVGFIVYIFLNIL